MFTLRPVYGEAFLDREELLQELVQTLSSSQQKMGFALVGPRRMGKTSVFLETVRRLKEIPRVVPVYVSLWELVEGTPEELSQELVAAAMDAFREKELLPLKVRARNLLKAPLELLRDILGGMRISLKLREELELVLMLTRGQGQASPGEIVSRALGLPERLGGEMGVRCALFLDEFPTVLELRQGGKPLGEGIVRRLRTEYETMENLVLSISGSVHSTMEAVALRPAAAFWRQFIVREVGPLPRQAVEELLTRNLDRALTPEALSTLWEFTQGIPFYVQFIGRELGRREGKRVTKAEVEGALADFLREEGGVLFQEQWQRLSAKERKIMQVMSQGYTSPTVIAREADELPNTVSQYLQYLKEKGLVEHPEPGEWRTCDPVFTRWLALRAL
jgi:AAA+ ATPase superfamily predicted ATPase